eukprot:CAMPEP_0204575420 /NCGR_PEP_ID=MMETSP0661-20131031/41181_1 /ASSEMBLY_ACC=CAM_ASM_000606 /TAXON_ID=109239 /ORGANISM="Alexandrium margalefi, Strain AMGDE01CS-322" /LENGTH=333 /DNA_ID=CAMNT_0051584049 /DNA_START=87 /DNA_END=1088 /DNA_ORIENTATION=-
MRTNSSHLCSPAAGPLDGSLLRGELLPPRNAVLLRPAIPFDGYVAFVGGAALATSPAVAQEVQQAGAERPRDGGEPKELHGTASNHRHEEKLCLPAWHCRRHSRVKVQPEEDRPIGVQYEPENHEEDHEEDAIHLHRRLVGIAPVPYEEQVVQERGRGLHGQEHRGIERQHAVAPDNEACGDEGNVVYDEVPGCQAMYTEMTTSAKVKAVKARPANATALTTKNHSQASVLSAPGAAHAEVPGGAEPQLVWGEEERDSGRHRDERDEHRMDNADHIPRAPVAVVLVWLSACWPGRCPPFHGAAEQVEEPNPKCRPARQVHEHFGEAILLRDRL